MDDQTVRVARHAMGTRFEILLEGGDARMLRAAGEEALDEIERLDRQLSLFRPESEISRINSAAAAAPVRVEAGLFRLLVTCRDLWMKSGEMFDVTVGPLMRCWGFREERREAPSDQEIAAAREVTGMGHVILDEGERSVRFDRDGVALDLGAVAKGWALDQAALLLREAGIDNALLHGGSSAIRAMGRSPAPDSDGWIVAIRPPPAELLPRKRPWPGEFIRSMALRDEALSVSAISGRYLERSGRIDGHVLDPRRGAPVPEGLLAAVVLPSATDSDALSTALLAGGLPLQESLSRSLPSLRSLLLSRDGDDTRLNETGGD